MTITSLLYSVGSVPMFASRPFLAALLTSLLCRFGDRLPLVNEQLGAALAKAPAWYTSNIALGVMAVLAALELASAKSPEIRAALDEVDGFVKAGVAMVVSSALLDKDSIAILKTVDHSSLIGLHSLWTLLVGSAVYVLSALRKAVVGFLFEIDDHDDLGVATLISRIETTWTAAALLFLVVFPIVALLLSGLTALALWWLRRRAERAEEAAKIPCSRCAAKIHPSAVACQACGQEQAAPRAVGVFGQPKAQPAANRELHRFELIARKRCPVCATRLKQRAVRQSCPGCQRVTMSNQQEFESYLSALGQRLPKTLLICLLLGAIPVVGVIPGVAYYRLTVIAGLRGYIPPLRGCFAKWIVRVVNWGMIALQPIPGLGALVLPLMCLTNYWIYRRALRGRAEVELALPAGASAV